MNQILDFLNTLLEYSDAVIVAASRIVLPVIAALIIIRCLMSLFSEKYEPEVWGYLAMPGGMRLDINHWETIIGRGRNSDILLNIPTVSRTHASLIRLSDGTWKIYDLHSKSGVRLNGEEIERSHELKAGDIIECGGAELVFVPYGSETLRDNAGKRAKPGRYVNQGLTLFILTLFNLMMCIACSVSCGTEYIWRTCLAYFLLTAMVWISYIITRILSRRAFELETLAFLMCSVGMEITVSSTPEQLFSQLGFMAIGLAGYFILGWVIRDIKRVKLLRWAAAGAGVLLLCINMVFSERFFGARNWLSIGGISFQPSEIVKICFIFAGAATLDRMFEKRNLILFIGFAGFCVLSLAILSDFGTAIIFFAAYLIIAFMRSGSIGTIFLSVGGTALAAVLVISMKPYIAERFATWRHAWEFVYDAGYQQTRTMTCAASGGLFGLGACRGWLKYLFAANTDMVFGMVVEELGLILGLLMLTCIVIMGVYSIKYTKLCRSSFYAIAAVAASGMLIFQMTLNTLGCVDILPFTGVTFPFISRGGSSLISCWWILAFIKSCDMRQNASFITQGIRKKKNSDDDDINIYNITYDNGEEDFGDIHIDLEDYE